ncbi:MAG: hypothetical protein ACFFG0_33405, partial [Candidatus Thorarchaeota archaeon]
FMMESYLLFTGIRPSGFDLLLYDSLILTNQGIPYLYIIFDKIIPKIKERIIDRKDIKEEIVEVSTF